jgi:hypothetical protein
MITFSKLLMTNYTMIEEKLGTKDK